MERIQMAATSLPRVFNPNPNANFLPYGDDNLYPQHLIKYRLASPTHQAILNMKTQLIVGEGLLQHYGSTTMLNDMLLEQIAADYSLFNGFALEILWSRDRTEIAEIRHLPFQHLRALPPNNDGEVLAYIFCPDWERDGWTQDRRKWIPRYDPALASKYPRQVLYCYEYSPGFNAYPTASYHSALADIRFEQEYGLFKLASMQNGMFPALHIAVHGEPTTQEKEAFYAALKQKFGGSSSAGDVLVTYGAEGAGKTEIKPIEMKGNSDLFQVWAANATQRIISAHRLSSPVLAGLPGRSGLGGGGSEISVAHEYYFNTVIKPMQNRIEAQLMSLIRFIPKGPKSLTIANSKPIRFVFNESLLSKILSENELREEIGFGPRIYTEEEKKRNGN